MSQKRDMGHPAPGQVMGSIPQGLKPTSILLLNAGDESPAYLPTQAYLKTGTYLRTGASDATLVAEDVEGAIGRLERELEGEIGVAWANLGKACWHRAWGMTG